MTETEINKLADLFLGISDSYYRDHLVAAFNDCDEFDWYLIPQEVIGNFDGIVMIYNAIKKTG